MTKPTYLGGGGPERSSSNTLWLIGGVVLVVAAASVGLMAKRFAVDAASPQGGEQTIDVAPGMNFFAIRAQLSQQGIEIDPFALRVWIKLRRAGQRLRVGEYKVNLRWSKMRILDEILRGTPLLHKITVKEGFNRFDIAAEIRRVWGDAGATAFEKLVHDPELMQRMGVPATLPMGAHASLEGFLFPETYSYQKYDTPRDIVLEMLAQFERRAKPILDSHPWGQTPEGRYRLLTLASIIEKESGQADEQPLVASVFWNRISKKMRLQSDPTTIYGLMPTFDGNLKRIHLTTASAYNTYTLPELPVGPISNPGETALRAAVTPALSDYLYFVGRQDGTHQFSKDYATHSAAVRKFQLKVVDPEPHLAVPKLEGGTVLPKKPTNRSGSRSQRPSPKAKPRPQPNARK